MELLKLNDILTLIPPPLIIWNIAHDPGPQQRHHRPWRPMLALASEFSFEWRNVERRQCAPRPPPSGENFSYRSNSGEHRTRDPGLGLKCLLLPLHLASSSHIPNSSTTWTISSTQQSSGKSTEQKTALNARIAELKKVFPFCLTIYSEHVYGLGEIVGDARMLDGCIRAKSVKPRSARAGWQLAQPKYLLLWFPEQNFMSLTF